jgi:hypothetical protein
MRQAGDRVTVAYPHEPYYDSNYRRVGTLVRVVQEVPHAKEGMKDIWEVKLDANPRKPEELRTYNEFWLHTVLTYDEWKQNNDGSAFVNWESLDKMTEEEAGDLYDGLLETFTGRKSNGTVESTVDGGSSKVSE